MRIFGYANIIMPAGKNNLRERAMINIVEVLKALADETRLRIINLLYDGELCVCDIMETLAITQTKASRHLGVLRRAGLVTDRKSAQWVYYTICRSDGSKFLDSIIFNQLRQNEPYADDMKNLAEWLAVKKSGCNKYANGPLSCGGGTGRHRRSTRCGSDRAACGSPGSDCA